MLMNALTITTLFVMKAGTSSILFKYSHYIYKKLVFEKYFEIINDLSPVKVTEKCINTIGSFECECNDGFFLEHMVVFGQVITGRGRQKSFNPRVKK